MLWTEYLLNMNWSEPFKIKFSLKSLFYNAFQAQLGYSSNTFYIFSQTHTDNMNLEVNN